MKQKLQYEINKSEYAEVISISHPLITARGFTNINPGEMVVFENGNLGQILSFTNFDIKLMLFSKQTARIGDKLYRTNKQLSFPITSQILGSVFNSVGDLLIASKKNPVNDKEIIFKEIFQQPPKISQRRRTTSQLMTGFSVTDLLLPIGEGQRELVIGDRKSGKTNFAQHLAVKQAQIGNKVVYAMIAKATAEIRRTYDFFIKNNVMDSVTIIASTPKDSISSIVITPHSAMTVAEELLDQGENVLLVLNDLTSQAEFYREISLLAKKFPGRDSYPGDTFFSQARLLERAGTFAHPKDPQKNISLTCIPVVRTFNSDLTDFIVSNLISITDGHLLFDQRLFNQGVRPAVNIGLSVTRVGKQTQTQLQRDINLKITSFLTSYKKTKSLTHLGSEISTESQRTLKKGELITDFFSENNGLPMAVQIVLLTMIWLDWFQDSHKNVVTTCKFELDKRYSDEKGIKEMLDDLINKSNSFDELLKNIKNEKTTLINLCQV